jgi:hypothetical protein
MDHTCLDLGGAQPVFSDDDFCFACGMKNPLGLQLKFYLDGERMCARVTPMDHWQGYHGVLHGGLQATILDDLMNNHLFRVQRVWTATAELKLRYRLPVPLDRELLFYSELVGGQSRVWELRGACMLAAMPEGKPLTTAVGRFMEVPAPG